LDSRTHLQKEIDQLSQILLRRVRPTFSGTVYKYVDYYFRPDFGQGSTVIYDAYVELKYFNFAKVRVGKFKPGVSLERLQSDDDTTFVERGMPTMLAPSRDIGYQISGPQWGGEWVQPHGSNLCVREITPQRAEIKTGIPVAVRTGIA
jgi:phosphate-selective porin